MAEYNWWDDRTIEDNDNYFCPIIYGCCLDKNCEKCKDYEEFVKEVNERYGKENN